MISQPLTIIRTNKMGKPYIQNSDPSLTNTMSQNDLWLNISEGTMKAWDGTGWVEMQFGESAIMDDCITNRMISNDISATKITAGILQSVDGSFYLNLDTGEAELLKLVMGGQVEGNIIATSSNGLTRIRLRGKEGTKDITAGLIFEERETTDDDWDNCGQLYMGYSSHNSVCTVKNYQIGNYNGSRLNSGYSGGTSDGLVWRGISLDFLKDCRLTYHGVYMTKREDDESSFERVTPVLTAVGQLMSGTAIVGVGSATLTYQLNDVMQIDFHIRITTSGSGTSTYGIYTSLLRTLNSEIPALTPLSGGVLQVFDSSGALKSILSTSFLADGAYWHPAYMSSTSATSLSNIIEASFSAGMRLIGTCYASYTLED